jgi:signal transduction histidine kinase
MTKDGSTIGAAGSGLRSVGNGAVPRRDEASDLLADVARLTEECETLRLLAAARAAEMQSLSRRKDESIAIASHDIKTPMPPSC